MHIMTIGGSMQDLCVYYPEQRIESCSTAHGNRRFLLMEEGSKIELSGVSYFPGGGANNTAVAYARQGFTTSIVSCIGADCQGLLLQDNLISEGVNTSFLVQCSQSFTGFSLVIRLTTGDRIVLVNRGANVSLSSKHVTSQMLTNVDQLYITSLVGCTADLLPIFAAQAFQKNIPVAVNPGTSQLKAGADALCKALPFMQILILNAEEAHLLFCALSSEQAGKTSAKKDKQCVVNTPLLLQANSFLDLRLFCSLVQQKGPKIVVVTNGKEGVYVATPFCFYFYPSKPCSVVSTLGAGDAFGSGFVGQYVRTGSVESAILYGMANSHSVIGHEGAQQGLLSAQALERAVKSFDTQLLQQFR